MRRISFILALALTFTLLAGCGAGGKNEKMRKYFVSQLSDVEVGAADEEGLVTVTLTGPDIAALAELLDGDITAAGLQKAAKAHPELVKEYTVTAESGDEADIEAAYLDMAAYELLVDALASELEEGEG